MKSFPLSGLLPKKETLADQFLEKYPEYDGRNTIVAIFDTGVDPGAIGLQVTSDGKPKIIDIIDATGSCDVDTSQVLEANDGILTLSSGKNLILNPEWKTSVGGKYHVGTEAAYNLFPKLLVERLKIERREKFDISQRDAMNEVQRHLAEWQRNNPQDTDDVKLLRIRKDLKSRLAQLEDLSKNYEDPGPIYDCVVFYDGENWRAAVDTKETGDFTGVPAMTDFKIERQYARFSEESQLNYCLNVYDDGNILSIVCDAGAHGTHVAGIVAAYHPDQPECNGIAPGAQIISVKIGDTRLGSMETTTALSRAIQAIINSKCDIVNMSYGEYAGDHNIGRIVELAKELVEEHNITFVCSAGNNGPSLGSVGAPGGSSTCLLGVGAYVSPRMMDAEYIMRDNDLTGNLYTWSSRGPTFDGDLGVNICAPGAAIAPVPNWTLNKKQLMNGTSMSSPNCAGNISLMLSGLKDQGIEYNAYSIRRTLEKTSVKLDKVEVFAQGKGLIQVLPAFENMIRYCNQFDGTKKFPLYYEVKASSLNSGRGIFLKDAGEFLHDSTEVQVNVKPVFHKIAPQEHKVHFEMHINFIPTARWIEVGKHLAVMHEGRAFKVLLKTKNLPVGDNYAEIAAYDAANHEIGPLFTIPVIVIKPEKIEALPAVVKYRKDLTPGMISRRFFDPPSDATWADITICRSTNEEFESNSSSKLYVLHMMQFEVHERQSLTSYKKSFSLKPGEQVTHSCDVRGGLTIEVCLAQFWSALGNSSAEVKVEFHGIVPNQEKIHLSGGEGAKKVLVRSTITTETLNPQVSFNKWIQRLRPNSSEISPLSSARDIFPDKRQVYQLILTYAFSKKECGKVSPRLPLLNGRLYESPFEGQMCQIFDDLKRYIGASDAYPEGISLKKGSYTIRAQIRHEDVSKLEKLKNAILFLDHDIKDLSAKVYGGPDDPAIGGKLVENRTLLVSTWLPLYIGEPEKMPDGSSPGDLLAGKVYFGKKNGASQGSGRKPGGFEITYSIPSPETPTKEPEMKEAKDEKDEEKQAKEAIRDLLVSRLLKLSGKNEFIPAWKRVDEQFPSNLVVLQTRLRHFDAENARHNFLDEIVEAADAIINLIDQNALTLHFGLRFVVTEGQASSTVKEHKEKEKEKQILIDAMSRKIRALGDLSRIDEQLKLYQGLQKWADIETPPFLHVGLQHDRHFGLHGLSLQRLRKVMDLDKGEREKIATDDKLKKELSSTYICLKWNHWDDYEKRWGRRRSPRAFRGF